MVPVFRGVHALDKAAAGSQRVIKDAFRLLERRGVKVGLLNSRVVIHKRVLTRVRQIRHAHAQSFGFGKDRRLRLFSLQIDMSERNLTFVADVRAESIFRLDDGLLLT